MRFILGRKYQWDQPPGFYTLMKGECVLAPRNALDFSVTVCINFVIKKPRTIGCFFFFGAPIGLYVCMCPFPVPKGVLFSGVSVPSDHFSDP